MAFAAAPSFAGLRLCLFVGLLVVGAEGHGRLTVPRARNGGDNGAVGGGPGSVHAFDASGEHAKYKHGICGNAAGAKQVYNRVGDVQETYVAGEVAELKVVITAHHVGYFEIELCADAGSLSEECFMEHRLLREGCTCSCPDDDSTNSCSACDECRRWWKPLLEGETGQVVAKGYPGPLLAGQGNLVPYEFTLRYVIPAGVKTSRGVLRWHYLTTNSCTSKTSAPEEFWNCADIAVSDENEDVGQELSFSNADLENLSVEDLLPAINSGELTGVYATCPEDDAGGLLGVGAAEEYKDLCGPKAEGAYERCVDMSGGSAGGANCSEVPASGILCESECSNGWFQCSNGVAYTKYVPEGTKCKDGQFVLEAECDSQGTTSVPTEAPEPTPTEEPVVTSTTEPTAAPTTTAESGSGDDCGDCAACLWSSGGCFADVDADYCGQWPDNKWCGGASSA